MHNHAELFNWDDLRFFLAVARHGSTIAAARALGVNQSTVQRRMAEFERGLGQTLLKRETTGYRLTELAERLVGPAQQVELAAHAFTQEIDAATRALSGVVRVTCPEPIVLRLSQSPLLARFHATHPQLRVEFVMSDRYLSLAAGEVDVALRSGDTDEPDVVGRKIADSLWAVYGSRTYVAQHGAPASVAELARHDLVAFDDSMAGHRTAQWLSKVAPAGNVVARNNSVLGLLYAARAGLGLAPLPTALGDAEPELMRVLGPVAELTREWRVLAHRDHRRTPRVAAFFDFIVSEVDALKPILTG